MKHSKLGLCRFVVAVCLLAFLRVSCAQNVVTYYHTDITGSPIAATNSSGAVIWREEFTPYGEKALQEVASESNRMWFTGHHHDDQTGLTYAGARHYDPMIGRFMGVDPAAMDPANQFTFSRYAYANNNPYAYVDPDGAEVGAAFRSIYIADGGGKQQYGYRTLPTQPLEYALAGGLVLVALPIAFVTGSELLLAASPATISSVAISTGELAGGDAVVGGIAATYALAKSSDVLLTEARAARDALARELGSLPRSKRPATVTAGYNVETGQVAARACSGGGAMCAEDNVVAALGGDKSKVRFTEAARPRPHEPPYREVDVCPRCEERYGRESFPAGTQFKSDAQK